MAEPVSLTGDGERWPHLEAAYQLALRAAEGFALPSCARPAFTSARWGLLMGLAIARIDPELAETLGREMENHDLARDGIEAATFAKYQMMHDVHELRRNLPE